MNLGSMSDTKRHLWQCISSFPIDAPDALKDFSARLREENRWTGAFAKRAVEEYRRFIYLSQVAGHPVSPSEEVDQVWHLHLIYTKSYWQDLCEGVLGRPFHHEPSRGGVGESAKYRELYAQTLESYERVFGEKPPADLWPPVEKRFAPQRHQWVDVSRHWVVRRPDFLKRLRLTRSGLNQAAAALTVVMLVALVAGCTKAANLFDWTGPEFAKAYLIALPTALLLSFLLVRLKRGAGGQITLREDVDPYDAAFLGGGGGRTVTAAMASLYGRGLIEFGESKGRTTVVRTSIEPPAMHEMEWAAHHAAPAREREPADLREVRMALDPRMETMRDRLVERRWIHAPEAVTRLRWLAALPFLILIGAGLIKMGIGLEREKPVLYLVIMMVMAAFLMITRAALVRRRTAEGEAVWQTLLGAQRQIKARLQNSHAADLTATMPMAVALLGAGAFVTPEYAPLRERLGPAGSGSSSGCGSATTGCGGGSSGCGGGSSGCGGCGGGGD
jgi:uncharacterized protein (TIGR04222 family)